MKNYSFEYPELTGIDAYENLWKGLRKACKHAANVIQKNLKRADYVYVHIKETDLPGHDNKPVEKKLMLEYIDITLFKYLRSIVTQNKIKVVVTGDHSTPCKLKGHSADPVPVLFYNFNPPLVNLILYCSINLLYNSCIILILSLSKYFTFISSVIKLLILNIFKNYYH
ncbi:MAG: hypothetical protein NTZ83_02890 [Candidatus Pacearchaeota archaeon]|nr:hypothetical protein [Candidatus Pacearchaeota archaeon]